MPRNTDRDDARKETQEAIDTGRPVIRSIAAFLLYLRFGTPLSEEIPGAKQYDVGRAHGDADKFLRVLDEDLGA